MGSPQLTVYTVSKICNGACWETESILLELMEFGCMVWECDKY